MSLQNGWQGIGKSKINRLSLIRKQAKGYNNDMKFEFGITASDKITGFQGVITAFSQYVTGCAQYLVQPKMSESGEFREGRWFDEQRLVDLNQTQIVLENEETPGPDQSAPIK